MKIIWTDGAVEDLQAAFDYLEASSPEAAFRFAEAILARVGSLQTMPHRGRRRRSDSAYENYVHPWPYVIIYEIVGEAVYIAGVMHTSRDRQL